MEIDINAIEVTVQGTGIIIPAEKKEDDSDEETED